MGEGEQGADDDLRTYKNNLEAEIGILMFDTQFHLMKESIDLSLLETLPGRKRTRHSLSNKMLPSPNTYLATSRKVSSMI